MLTDWNDIFTFGKFKDETVKYVFEHDATYLWWVINNTQKSNFPQEIKNAIQEKTEQIESEKYSDMDWGDYHDIF